MIVDVSTSKIVNMANAIRSKKGISEPLTLPMMAELIKTAATKKASGTYDASGNMVRSWDDLLATNAVKVDGGVLTITQSLDPGTYEMVCDLAYPDGAHGDSREWGIVIDESVKEISDEAFLGAHNFYQIVLPQGLQKIGQQAFYNTRVTGAFKIPDSVTQLSDYACSNMDRVTEFIIPDHLSPDAGNIGVSCFQRSGIVHLTVPNHWTKTGEGMFQQIDPLKSITFGASLLEINKSCFTYDVELTDVILPASLKVIQDYAFSNCRALEEITIPDGVTSISDTAFYHCTNLTTIHYSGAATGAPWGATNATVVP